MVDGMVTWGEDVEEGLPYFQALRRKHGRSADDVDALRDEMLRDGRVLLVITPDLPQGRWHCRGFES